MPNHIILSTLRCIDCIDCITADECSYLAAGLLYDQNFFGSYPFYKNISYFQADFVLIKMVLYLPNFSLVFLIHVFLYAGVYCIPYITADQLRNKCLTVIANGIQPLKCKLLKGLPPCLTSRIQHRNIYSVKGYDDLLQPFTTYRSISGRTVQQCNDW